MSNQPEVPEQYKWMKPGAKATLYVPAPFGQMRTAEITLKSAPVLIQDIWAVWVEDFVGPERCEDVKPSGFAPPSDAERLARIVGMVESFQAEHTNVDAMDEYVASGDLLEQIKSIAKGEKSE